MLSVLYTIPYDTVLYGALFYSTLFYILFSALLSTLFSIYCTHGCVNIPGPFVMFLTHSHSPPCLCCLMFVMMAQSPVHFM